MPGSISRRRLLRTAALCAASAALAACTPAEGFVPRPPIAFSPETTLVVYESVYGNTEQIAQAIGAVLGLDAARVKRATEATTADMAGITMLVIGSPTHAFTMMPSIKAFISSLPRGSLAGVRALVFDTRLSQAAIARSGGFLRVMVNWFGYAAEKIARALKNKGTRFSIEFAWFTVDDSEGPLSEGELERAVIWAERLA